MSILRHRPAPTLIALVWVALSIAPSLLAQKILYTTSKDGNSEIYVMNVDGSAVTRLTNTPEDEYGPRWSADGSAIYFSTSVGDEVGRSYSMRANGSDRTPQSPRGVWSPDGLTALSSSQDGLLVVDVDSYGAPTNLYYGSGDSLFSNLQWAPDSFRILFSWSTGGRLFPYDAFYTTDVYGGPPRRIIAGGGLQEASWSPDGSKILVVREDAILVFDADGGADPAPLVKFGTFPIYDAAWSPDGSQIAYITMGSNPNRLQLFQVNSSGGSPELVIDGPVGAEYTQLRYAPNGSKIVLDNPYSPLWDNSGPAAIYSVDTNGKNWRSLAADDAYFADITAAVGAAAPAVYGNGVVLSNLAPAVHSVSSLAIASIFGSGFATGSSFGPALTDLDEIGTKRLGTCVELGGVRAPILAITPTQVNVQVPALQSLGPISVAVIRDCDRHATWSNVVTVTMEQATPAFFLYTPYESDGYIAARFNDGFAAVAPDGAIVDKQGASRPARPGESISLFGTGWGPTKVSLAAGQIAKVGNSLIDGSGLTVTFDGVPLDPDEGIEYAGIAPGFAGVYQLAIRVPLNAQPGNHQIRITVHGKSSPAGPVIPVAGP